MQSTAKTVSEYMESLPADRKKIMQDIRSVVKKNIPKGFEETMGYGMIGYVVPHKIFPAGYHCDPSLPLPFVSLASQKNNISFYHMGLYDATLMEWFKSEWAKISSKKLDIGKTCIRFKKPEDVPLELLGKLVAKMTPQQWIDFYQKTFVK